MTIAGTRPAPTLVDLGPVAQLRAGRLLRRLPQLFIGLYLFGVSLAMMVLAGVGTAPWDVLHLGLIRHVPITLGQAVIAVSFVVLLAWIPMRERPGIGTIANALLVGLSADVTLLMFDAPEALVGQVTLMIGGVALCGLASALYIGAQFGRGPRDGLMTGLSRRTGLSLRLVRTALEVSVVVVGILLGGVAGLGTIVYALGIGPLTQALLPWCLVPLEVERA